MAVISVYFFDGTHRTCTTHLLSVFKVSKYAVWFYNQPPSTEFMESILQNEPFPKSISLAESDKVFDGLMTFHQNGKKSKKDLAHFLIDHGCEVSRLPERWNGDRWTGEYCDYFNVEIS